MISANQLIGAVAYAVVGFYVLNIIERYLRVPSLLAVPIVVLWPVVVVAWLARDLGVYLRRRR